jgi:FMN-dependent NADH-azoreductase
LSDTLIAELVAADEVLVSSPLYNFGPPSALKAYLDHVVRFGRTIGADERGSFGLLRGKSVFIVTARGGTVSSKVSGSDFQGPLLQSVFHYMGFERVEWVSLEGTALGGRQLESSLARARLQVDAWFKSQPMLPDEDGIEWQGMFSSCDRAEINALRAGQVSAILAGDAEAYAKLCTDDIRLMLQGYDAVVGRQQFLECETRLFQTTRFTAMRQIPSRVEQQGQLAVETGRQEVQTAIGAAQAESFKAQRKYLHVLRKTAEGWRFAILMSNNSVMT